MFGLNFLMRSGGQNDNTRSVNWIDGNWYSGVDCSTKI